MANKFAELRRGARTAKARVGLTKSRELATIAVDHRKGALFGSASAAAVAAMLTAAVVLAPAPARATVEAPASCTESSSGSGNWFCNNDPPVSGGDLNGNADDNTIEIVGGSYTDPDLGGTSVYGLEGKDTITIRPRTDTTPNGSIAIDGSIYGGANADTITIGGGAVDSKVGWVNINGNVDGGDGDDTITITASDIILTGINKLEGAGGDVLGGAGDDKINVTNASTTGKWITIEGSVKGEAGKDDIDVSSTNSAPITVKGDVFGDSGTEDVNDGDDTIDITAGTDEDENESAGTIAINGNVGGDGGKDSIVIEALSGGTVTLGTTTVEDGDKNGNVLGGSGVDGIILSADGKDSTITSYGGIAGGSDKDEIDLYATNDGKVVIKHDVFGDTNVEDALDGDDTIKITAGSDKDENESAGTIAINGNVGGDGGKDSIVIQALSGGTVTLGTTDVDKGDLNGNVLGGSGEDYIGFGALGTKSKALTYGGIAGGSGNDKIEVLAQEDGDVVITHDVVGDKGGENEGDGADIIDIYAGTYEEGFASAGTIAINGNVSGDGAVDRINVGALSGGTLTLGTTDVDKGDLNGNILGGSGEDYIGFGAMGTNSKALTYGGIAGGSGSDKIEVIAKVDGDVVITHDVAGDSDDKGLDGDDTINILAGTDEDENESAGTIAIKGDVSGDGGKDAITIKAVSGGSVTLGTTDKVNGDEGGYVLGGEGNDSITFSAVGSNSKATTYGEIAGEDGEDTIAVTADKSGTVSAKTVDGGIGKDSITIAGTDEGAVTVTDIFGGSGNDTISVGATKDGKVKFGTIDGDQQIVSFGADPDTHDDGILLVAAEGGEIDGNSITGNKGDDYIILYAASQSDIDIASTIDGSTGKDLIGLISTGKGTDIDVENVNGGAEDDFIGLAALDNGDVSAEIIDGGEGKDQIILYANGGQVFLDDVEGGAGEDNIAIVGAATQGTYISLDNIRGGSEADTVILASLNNLNSINLDPNFAITGEINGGGGYDTLIVSDSSSLESLNIKDSAGSTLRLDDVDNFNTLVVEKTSYLELTQSEVEFGDSSEIDGLVAVDSTSYLRLSDPDAILSTGTVLLEASQDGEFGYRSIYTGADAGWLDQTGGVLDVAGNTATGFADTTVNLDHADGNTVPQSLAAATFINQGTIALHSGLSVNGASIDVAGDRLTINGDYRGGGNLLIDTYLFDAASPTDMLIINGNVAAESTTTIYVNNTNPGEGIYTGTGFGQGIKVVDVSEGGVSPDDAFQLARNKVSGEREVMAGAYSYRLYQDPDNEAPAFGKSMDTGAGDWYLRAGYNAQATGYATAPSAMQRHFYAGLDTLHKRLGEVRQQDQLEGRNADLAQSVTKAPAYQPVPAPKFQMWGRGGGADLTYDVSGGWDFSQQTWGLQAGGDYTFDYNDWRITAGAFGGYGWSDVDVDGDWTSWGGNSSMEINGWNAGIYASIRQVGILPGAGFYTDLVGKVDVLDLDIASTSNVTANTDATVWGGSIEMGYGFEISNGWVIQPQAQLTYASASQDAYFDSIGTSVSPGDAESLIGRLGLQVQSTFVMATGQTITPYAIFNVNSEFLGDNKTNVAGTVLTSDINGTWYNAGIGFTADLNGSVALFGTGEYNFGDVQGWAGQGGLKIRW